MVSRALIGLWNWDNTISAIYLHENGYPVHGAGEILANKYPTWDQVWELIELGHLFVLGSELSPDFSKPHSIHNPQPDVTVAFHRDHGRPESPPFVVHSLNEYVAYGRTEIEAEYLYLFACGTWFIYFLNGEQPPYWYDLNYILGPGKQENSSNTGC